MGRGLQRVAEICGGLTVITNRGGKEDSVVYGPYQDDARTTKDLKAQQDIKLVGGKKPFDGKVVRVIDDKIILVVRRFPTSGKMSKPYKAHISAIEPTLTAPACACGRPIIRLDEEQPKDTCYNCFLEKPKS